MFHIGRSITLNSFETAFFVNVQSSDKTFPSYCPQDERILLVTYFHHEAEFAGT